ncbi:MAG: hypothetical protein AAB621_01950 [Patescibacteria group bacterium]
MDIWLKLFNMFNAAAKAIFDYIPQNKEDLLGLLKQGLGLLGSVNIWLGNALGIDIQKIINIFTEFIIKYFSLVYNFLMELIKKLAERV